MNSSFLELKRLLQNNSIRITNFKLNNAIHEYNFLLISEKLKTDEFHHLSQKMNEYKIVIINQLEEEYGQKSNKYFIISFKKTILLINQVSIVLISDLFHNASDISILFLADSKKYFDECCKIKYSLLKLDPIIQSEISNFNDHLSLVHSPNVSMNKQMYQIWKAIRQCISGLLIKQSYSKLTNDRFFDFYYPHQDTKKISRKWEENEFIILRSLGCGSVFVTFLIYEIESEELFVLKKPCRYDNEITKLKEREIYNYSKIRHPLIPKYYGQNDGQNSVIIEFVNGQTLNNIEKLREEEKITIIYEIMLVISYFHNNRFILRDLKLDNIMIDSTKTVVLIDFDRMLYQDDIKKDNELTVDFSSCYADPNVNLGIISFANDIYSLGKTIEFIIKKKEPENNNIDMLKYSDILKICKDCCDDLNERPNISDLIHYFLNLYHSQIPFSKYKYYPPSLFHQGLIYYENECVNRDINKAIYYFMLASDLNHSEAQYYLGYIFYFGDYISQDIDKAIHYFMLSANQNHRYSQYYLGLIYFDGKYIQRDIHKAIHYFTLSAEQNVIKSQFYLGSIYLDGKYTTQDIEKSIYYFTLSSEQNDQYSQFLLGFNYYCGEYISVDINKAIYFLDLSAKQNNDNAQFYLGLIYYEGKHISQDIKKAIHYFTLAADQNQSNALFYLGVIYYEGKYVYQDIKKAIQYFSLSADHDHKQAQFNLGVIYSDGKYIQRDIKIAIHYYSLAANNHFPEALYILGDIYYKGKYVPRNVNKAIQYYTEAVNHDHSDASYMLGVIYYRGQFVSKDINKSIHYFTIAANQNNPLALFYLKLIFPNEKKYDYFNTDTIENPETLYEIGNIIFERKNIKNANKAIEFFNLAADKKFAKAQYKLALIYFDGINVTKDVNKAFYYLSLAVTQNYPKAQYFLGSLYYEGYFIPKDINKAIYYLTLAANQNLADAQHYLGTVYYDEKFVNRDINKSIYYFSLASKQNHTESQFYLGFIYFEGKYLPRDINKAIIYYSLAAKQGNPEAQYYLGLLYFDLEYKSLFDPNKGMYYLYLSAEKGYKQAYFSVGFLYHQGKFIQKDIKKAIYYYKEASSFNNEYSKNNLGVIYKNGYGEEIQQNLGMSIEYFNEAIHKKRDCISIHNLANIYLYNEQINDIDKSIELLLISFNYLSPSKTLLCLALIKKYGFEINVIKNKLIDDFHQSEEVSNNICQIIKSRELNNHHNFQILYEFYRNIDLFYDLWHHYILSDEMYEVKNQKVPQFKFHKNISSDFYEGFGKDLINHFKLKK